MKLDPSALVASIFPSELVVATTSGIELSSITVTLGDTAFNTMEREQCRGDLLKLEQIYLFDQFFGGDFGDADTQCFGNIRFFAGRIVQFIVMLQVN